MRRGSHLRASYYDRLRADTRQIHEVAMTSPAIVVTFATCWSPMGSRRPKAAMPRFPAGVRTNWCETSRTRSKLPWRAAFWSERSVTR